MPGRPTKFKGDTYTISEIERMAEAIAKVDMTAFAAISVAAFAGLRLSELRGLRWSDYDGESLSVSRSVWRTHVGLPKTLASEGKVPVLPLLKKVLDEHRARVKGKDDEYIFAGEKRGAPLNLANLARRVIIPELVNTAADHEGPSVKWKGCTPSADRSHPIFIRAGIAESDSSGSSALGYWHDAGLLRANTRRGIAGSIG